MNTLATLLTVKECAKLLQVHPETIKRAIHSGELKAFKVGHRSFRITEEEFKIFLDKRSYSVKLPSEKQKT